MLEAVTELARWVALPVCLSAIIWVDLSGNQFNMVVVILKL